MRKLNVLLLATFLESFATICVERGVYFFTVQRLGFSDVQNLWLALAFGVAYAGGASLSHKISQRIGERKLLLASIVAQAIVHAAMAAGAGIPAVVVAGSTLLGALNGLKWPIIESYVCAGTTPAETAGVIGRFNVAWSVAIPLALAASGPIIGWWSPGLFLLPVLLNLSALVLMAPLPANPEHIDFDHPDRPDESQLVRHNALLTASRWLMLGSYVAMWVLAALTPGIFRDLGQSVEYATSLAGLMDMVRMLMFLALFLYTGWHGRLWPLGASMAALPAGFFLVIFGGNLPLVLAGEVIFGASAGVVYYSALYNAMVAKNASVDAGGGHEGLIGLGFAIGPACGLLGSGLSGAMHNDILGMLAGLGPIMAMCSLAAMKGLLGLRKK
jgi:MFS family permease